MSDERKPMTDEELAEVKKRLDAITSEALTNVPWKAYSVGKTKSGFEYFGIEGVVDAGLLYDRDYGYENGLGIDGQIKATFIANAPDDISRLLAEVERLNKVSRYLAEQMVHDGGAGLSWAGAFDEDCMRMYKTKEEAIQSWIDEANREVSNA